jgi:hypothetical protein
MLSILIPIYNYNVFPLVEQLHKQCLECRIDFEILCFDDFSVVENPSNTKINQLQNCQFKILEHNIGRSAIRNLLAKNASFENLLFLDADTLPLDYQFVSRYLKQINQEEKVVYGGIKYQVKKPENAKIFRWTYGVNREALTLENRKKNVYLSLLTLNFMIKKSIFEKVKFNVKIPNLRHEDTLFSFDLKKQKIKIIHIENPVLHLGLDDFEIAIKKEKQSIIALKNLIENNLISNDYVSISRVYLKIKKYKISFIFRYFYKIAEKPLLKNLSSTNPSLLVFDLFRLGFLCSIEN